MANKSLRMFRRTESRLTSPGFTIVELLIVIVVIAILAAITIVSYNGITDRAKEATLKTDLSTAAKKLAIYNINNGSYPASGDEVAADVTPPGGGTTKTYISDGETFCLSYVQGGHVYHVTQTGTVMSGECALPGGADQLAAEYGFKEGTGTTSAPTSNTPSAPQLQDIPGWANSYSSPAGKAMVAEWSGWERGSTTENDWTVMAWVYIGSGSNPEFFFDLTDNPHGPEYDFNSANGSIFGRCDQTEFCAQAWVQPGKVTANSWHHLAITQDGTSLIVYLDGQSVYDSNGNIGYLYGTPIAVGLVDRNETDTARFDDFRYFTTALTASHIGDWMNYPVAG